MSELAEHRAHLDLQINLLTEQKVAKILELLARKEGASEALGEAADDLTKPADPESLLREIKRSSEN